MEKFERSKARCVDYSKMGRFYQQDEKSQRPIKFTRQACSYLWERAAQAWRDGWLVQLAREQSAVESWGGCTVDDYLAFTSIPLKEVQTWTQELVARMAVPMLTVWAVVQTSAQR